MESYALDKRNFYVEKHNLVLICRFVIKSVIDKASVGDIDEDGPETVNLLATIEHILNHNAKVNMSLFSTNSATFWNFIKESTTDVKDSCVLKVLGIGSLKSNVARERAWLRLALMEKKLAEYLNHAMAKKGLLSKHYHDGAIIASEEMQLLVADIIGLEAIDFSFCLRNKTSNLEGRILVDYSPYLKFEHCIEGIENDIQERQDSYGASSHSTNHIPSTNSSQQPIGSQSHSSTTQRTPIAVLADSNLKGRLASLQRAFRTTSEQKGYLEQMLKKNQLEITAKQEENERLVAEKACQELKQDKVIQQFQNVILELQHDLYKVKANNKELQSVIAHLYSRSTSTDALDKAVGTRVVDSTSMHSDSMSMEDLALKEDNSSMKPMFGSLASDSGSLTVSYHTGSRRMIELSSPDQLTRPSTSLLSTSTPALSQSESGNSKTDQSDSDSVIQSD